MIDEHVIVSGGVTHMREWVQELATTEDATLKALGDPWYLVYFKQSYVRKAEVYRQSTQRQTLPR